MYRNKRNIQLFKKQTETTQHSPEKNLANKQLSPVSLKHTKLNFKMPDFCYFQQIVYAAKQNLGEVNKQINK